jgi:hypothetical protein
MKIAGLLLMAVLLTVIMVMPIAGLTELHGDVIFAFNLKNNANITETVEDMVELGPIRPHTGYYVLDSSDPPTAILVLQTNSGIKGLWVPVLSDLHGRVVFSFWMNNSVESTFLAESMINLKPNMNYYVFESSNSTNALLVLATPAITIG